ncbi:DNA helicase [Tanacetum coccineum]
MQRVTFRDRDKLESVVNLPGRKSTTLTEWFAYNEAYEDGRHLTYQDFPSEFVWYDDRKCWSRRRNSKSSIGRLAYVHPTSGELFYFRMLLCHRKGCTEFIDVQTINDVFYPTCRAACEALGLLGDDKEWDIAMQEASVSATPFSNLEKVLGGNGSRYSREAPMNDRRCFEALDRSLRDILTEPHSLFGGKSFLLGGDFRQTLPVKKGASKMEVISSCISESELCTLRSEEKIVLAVASSGIASLLLPSGRTAHSRFKLPLELTEESLCRITKNSHLGKLLANTDLIIWDEAPMNDRRCFEALDRSLRDILTEPHSLFGGKSVLLGGDFRQTLPVKKGASKMEVISSCISESELWSNFKVFTLSENMRLTKPNISADERSLISSFASWLLDIGDGKTGEPDPQDPENTSWVDIPINYCIPDNENGLQNLINFIYDQSETKIYLSHDEATPIDNNGAETEMFPGFLHIDGELLNGELLNGELLNGELPNGELLKGTGSELVRLGSDSTAFCLEILCEEKGFSKTAITFDPSSVNTKFAKPSILGKPVLQPHGNQFVVRQPTAFKSERPKISKERFASQVDVSNDLSKPVTTHYLPKRRESAPAKPHYMIATSSSRYSSNDIVHNHYLEEAKKKAQEHSRNLRKFF